MFPRTVDWTPVSPEGAGLRERKKHRLRQQLSDTATEMVLQRGFDSVRITEVADACGVSEKTVYNYFPTKESLILDRWQFTPTALLRALADPDLPPVEAALRVLDDELTSWTRWFAGVADPSEASARVRRFEELVRSTPSLRAYERDMAEALVDQVAHALAARLRLRPHAPEPRLAAAGLVELWRIQADSLQRHLAISAVPSRLRERVRKDVRRAARLLADGLGALEFARPPARAKPH